MATVTSSSSAVIIPSFTGRNTAVPIKPATAKLPTSTTAAVSRKVTVKASLKDFSLAVVAATAAAGILAGNAVAQEVLLGSDDGSLAFVPGNFTIASGEEIVFKNNAGFPHNVVFDEDEVPAGVNAAAISMPEEDLLNAAGETFKVTLTVKGTYSFYCAPHQGAGMVGKVTVN